MHRATDVLHAESQPTLIAAALAIAAGTGAYADPVRYDNTTGFQWEFGTTLDITIPAAAQTGAGSGPGVFGQYHSYDYDAYYGILYEESGWLSGDAASGSELFMNVAYCAVGTNAGTEIPGGLPTSFGYRWYHSAAVGHTYMDAFGFATDLPLGEPTYIAVRFGLSDGTHYGWVGVVRDGLGTMRFDVHATPFAWGYETEPGVPIDAGAIPAPAPLLALAIGAAPGLTRPPRTRRA